MANADKFDDAGENNQVSAIILCFVSLLAASLKPVRCCLAPPRAMGSRSWTPHPSAPTSEDFRYARASIRAAQSCPQVIAQLVMAKPLKRADGSLVPKLTPEQTLFFDTQLAFWYMFIYWIVSDERAESVSYLAAGELTGLGLAIIVVGSLLAFFFNISSYYFISFSGALTTAVGSNAVKIMIIVITAITDGGVKVGWAGVVLVAVFVAAYAYFSYVEKQRAREASAAPSEATPLASAMKGGGGPLPPPPSGAPIAPEQAASKA